MSDNNTVPFWSLFSFGRGLNITKSDYVESGIPCLSYGDIHARYKGFLDASKDELPKVSPKFICENGDALLETGDIVFADTSEDYEGSGDASCIINSFDYLFAGYHTTIAKPRDKTRIYSPYFGYYFQTNHFRDQVRKKVNGVKVYSVTNKILNSTRVLLPEFDEQKRVAQEIDLKVKSIKTLMDKLQTIKDNLEVYRISLIARAVTKGIDPTVAMKESGISWIGKIPANWKIGRLSKVGKFRGGSAFPEEFQGQAGNPIPFYKVADLSISPDDRCMYDADNTITTQQVRQLKASIIPRKSIVYAKIGAAMLLNKRRITTRDCCIDNNMTSYQPTGVLLDWAYFWLIFVDFGAFSFPATVPSLSEGRQGRIPILIPSYNEQEKISEYVKTKTDMIRDVSGRIDRILKLLKELQSSLSYEIIVKNMC